MEHYIMLLSLFLAVPASAGQVDVSALSASNTRQVLAAGSHLFTGSLADLDVSGRYVKTEGRQDQYDGGGLLALKIGALRLEGDFREFHTHRATGLSAGTGVGPVTLSAGLRFEYLKPDLTRSDAFRAGASLRYSLNGALSLVASGDYLRFDGGGERFDYRARASLHVTEHFGVFVSADELRDAKVQAAGLSVRF